MGSLIAVERGAAEITELDVRSGHYKRSDYPQQQAREQEHSRVWRQVMPRVRRLRG